MSAALYSCVLMAACFLAADQPGPPEVIDALVLVQLDATEVAGLDAGDRTVEGIRARLVEGLGLPPQARLEESTVARIAREETGGGVDLSHWMLLVLKLEADQRDALEEVVRRLNTHALVSHAEADDDAFGWEPPAKAGEGNADWPNDPLFRWQYYLHLIHAPQAWQITTGSREVTVAVLDDGCNAGLKDLAGRIRPGGDFQGGVPEEAGARDHGTAIATIIAAAGNNAAGMAGIDWQCQIMPIVMTQGGVAAWAQAIEHATRSGVDIINISGKLEFPAPSPILEAALEHAAAVGIVMVASAGNQNKRGIAWPASSPDVIAVGATDGAGHRWQDPMRQLGSNYGPALDIVAPGASIVALAERGKRAVGAGTSPSAAMVSGACALMLAVNPTLTPPEIRQILRDTADKIGPPEGWNSGYSEDFGYGRLNVHKAVRKAKQMAGKPPESTQAR